MRLQIITSQFCLSDDPRDGGHWSFPELRGEAERGEVFEKDGLLTPRATVPLAAICSETVAKARAILEDGLRQL